MIERSFKDNKRCIVFIIGCHRHEQVVQIQME